MTQSYMSFFCIRASANRQANIDKLMHTSQSTSHGTSRCQSSMLPIGSTNCVGMGRIRSATYALLPVDLRDIRSLDTELCAAGFDPKV